MESVKRFPSIATVQALRDYLDWHVQTGRGHYHVELRTHLLAVPPDGITHVDGEKLVIVSGVPGAV